MSKNKKIRDCLIVGAGVFGLACNAALQASGLDVVVADLAPSPGQGASLYNQRRVHKGYHYPRSLETAKLCKENHNRFVKKYKECILDVENYYLISADDSRTSAYVYQKFCDSLGYQYDYHDPQDVGVYSDTVTLCIKTEEKIFSSELLTEHLLAETTKKNILTNCEVVSIKFTDGIYETLCRDRLTNLSVKIHSKTIINSTYNKINDIRHMASKAVDLYQFENFEGHIVKKPSLKNKGYAIMDGPFFGLQPFDRDYHILCDVEMSVLESVVASSPKFTKIHKDTPRERFDRLKQKMSKWTDVSDLEYIKSFSAVKMVLADCEESDARPTQFIDDLNGFYTIFSGKIDTICGVQEQCVEEIKQYLSKK